VFINAKSPVQLENPPSGFKPLGGLAIEKLLPAFNALRRTKLPTGDCRLPT